jgi:hypothetical protein
MGWLIAFASVFSISVASAESNSLATQTNNEISASLAYYQYEEPGIMSLKGAKIGWDLRTTKTLQNDLFMRGELRYAFGMVNYSSRNTGNSSGEPDWYVEARGLVGKDWLYKQDVVAAYTGLGYRFLFNDSRGISSTGNWGYRRASNYLYLPVGIIYRSIYSSQARLVSTLEYDHLILGKQISMLSDGGQGDSDLTNTQRKGYGLKLSVMYEKGEWAIGPYLHTWNTDDSDWVPSYKYGLPEFDQFGRQLGGVEPENNTAEFGLKVGKQF